MSSAHFIQVVSVDALSGSAGYFGTNRSLHARPAGSPLIVRLSACLGINVSLSVGAARDVQNGSQPGNHIAAERSDSSDVCSRKAPVNNPSEEPQCVGTITAGQENQASNWCCIDADLAHSGFLLSFRSIAYLRHWSVACSGCATWCLLSERSSDRAEGLR